MNILLKNGYLLANLKDWAAADIPIVNKLVMNGYNSNFNQFTNWLRRMFYLTQLINQSCLSIKKSSKKSTFNNTSRT
jgi:hypothetical protein